MPTASPCILAAALLLSPLPALAAQEMQRRTADPSAAPGAEAPSRPVTLPDIAFDPARPFVGVWEGTFSGRPGESVPFTVVIEYVNGGYHGYSFLNNMSHPIRHLTDSLAGTAYIWEWRNSGGGFLVHTGRLSNHNNTLSGSLTFRDLPFAPEPGPAPTFSLRRRPASHS